MMETRIGSKSTKAIEMIEEHANPRYHLGMAKRGLYLGIVDLELHLRDLGATPYLTYLEHKY